MNNGDAPAVTSGRPSSDDFHGCPPIFPSIDHPSGLPKVIHNGQKIGTPGHVAR